MFHACLRAARKQAGLGGLPTAAFLNILLGYALVSNYLALYAVFLISMVWIVLVVPLEEKKYVVGLGMSMTAIATRSRDFSTIWKGVQEWLICLDS